MRRTLRRPGGPTQDSLTPRTLMSQDEPRYSRLPRWPREAKELPDDMPRERYFWFFVLPVIAAVLGMVRAALILIPAREHLAAEDWGIATGSLLIWVLAAFLVGYLFDHQRWMKQRSRRKDDDR